MSFFTYPWALALLIPAAVLWYCWVWRRQAPALVVPDLAGCGKRRGRSRQVGWLSAILCGSALAAAVVALARPRLGNERLIVRKQGIDMIMVLDLSGSMAALDVPRSITTEQALAAALRSGKVRTRLAVARDELRKFILNRPNDRIGLIGFAEYGFTLAPPTLDHDWLIGNLDLLQPGMIGDNTGIASPVASAVRRLADSPAPRRVLVLFTDGKNNVAHRLTPLQTAELAKEKNVVIYTVGIGSGNAYMEQEIFGHKRYVPYPSEFDEKLLREMAACADGRYFHAADAEGMKTVLEEINRLEKTSFEQPKYVEYREFAPLLAGLAALLLFLGMATANTCELTLP